MNQRSRPIVPIPSHHQLVSNTDIDAVEQMNKESTLTATLQIKNLVQNIFSNEERPPTLD